MWVAERGQWQQKLYSYSLSRNQDHQFVGNPEVDELQLTPEQLKKESCYHDVIDQCSVGDRSASLLFSRDM